MIVHAGTGCFLTQSEDVPMKERVFRSHVNINGEEDLKKWKEITATAKDELMAEKAVIDVDDMSYDAIKRVDDILGKIAAGINDVPMTTEQALELTAFYPEWKEGEVMAVGRKVKRGGTLYEVVQEHTSQSDWTPEAAVSLYKVVQVDATGEADDPIAWASGMELVNGKHYTEDGVVYVCTRDSGVAMHYALSDLVGTYVEVLE